MPRAKQCSQSARSVYIRLVADRIMERLVKAYANAEVQRKADDTYDELFLSTLDKAQEVQRIINHITTYSASTSRNPTTTRSEEFA